MIQAKQLILKNLILVFLVFTGMGLSAQTDSIEKAVFNNKLTSGEINADEFSKIGIEWNLMIKKLGKYPDLPLDQNKNVHYSFLNNFSNSTKEILFNRTLEWISINYGIFPANLYSGVRQNSLFDFNQLSI